MRKWSHLGVFFSHVNLTCVSKRFCCHFFIIFELKENKANIKQCQYTRHQKTLISRVPEEGKESERREKPTSQERIAQITRIFFDKNFGIARKQLRTVTEAEIIRIC